MPDKIFWKMKQIQFSSLFIIPVFLKSILESSFLPVLIESSLLIVLDCFLKSVLSFRNFLQLHYENV